jgi:hypothetical protein
MSENRLLFRHVICSFLTCLTLARCGLSSRDAEATETYGCRSPSMGVLVKALTRRRQVSTVECWRGAWAQGEYGLDADDSVNDRADHDCIGQHATFKLRRLLARSMLSS